MGQQNLFIFSPFLIFIFLVILIENVKLTIYCKINIGEDTMLNSQSDIASYRISYFITGYWDEVSHGKIKYCVIFLSLKVKKLHLIYRIRK